MSQEVQKIQIICLVGFFSLRFLCLHCSLLRTYRKYTENLYVQIQEKNQITLINMSIFAFQMEKLKML